MGLCLVRFLGFLFLGDLYFFIPYHSFSTFLWVLYLLFLFSWSSRFHFQLFLSTRPKFAESDLFFHIFVFPKLYTWSLENTIRWVFFGELTTYLYMDIFFRELTK